MTTTSPHILATNDRFSIVAGTTHAHTTMSDGELSPPDLVAHAHKQGLGVVCITDHHFANWRYHFGIQVNRPSVIGYGMSEYFDAIAQASRGSEGPLVVPGMEVMPHYRWGGIPPFLRCHAMSNLVVFGITDVAVLENMPLRLDGKGKSEDEAVAVSQELIDYIHGHGGLIYWSHLEAWEKTEFLTAKILYPPRPALLQTTAGYTGFGCFPEGYKENCAPGGRWDQQLQANIRRGQFTGPWVMGEADYHGDNYKAPYNDICNPVTVFLLQSLDREHVTQALATGKMYAYSGNDFANSVLTTFQLCDAPSSQVACSGDTLSGVHAPRLQLAVTGFGKGSLVRVVCGGKLHTQEETRELDIELPEPGEQGYACRAEILSPAGEHIFTNPIFVVPGQQGHS